MVALAGTIDSFDQKLKIGVWFLAVTLLDLVQNVPASLAKNSKIDHRHWISCDCVKDFTGRHFGQRFLCLKYWQRTFKPSQIQRSRNVFNIN